MVETAEQTEQGTEEQTGPGIHWISREEARARFDAEARRVMGMSGDEFLRRYDAGDFMDVHDDGENLEFVALEMLMPWGR